MSAGAEDDDVLAVQQQTATGRGGLELLHGHQAHARRRLRESGEEPRTQASTAPDPGVRDPAQPGSKQHDSAGHNPVELTPTGDERTGPGARGEHTEHGAAGHGPHHPHHPHHILIEPAEDRWKWRRKIRQDPRKLFFYRCAVGFAGFVFIALGIVTGPLPGPGGIPLVLLGLAIWASEFEWAHKLMQWFKQQLHRYRGWPARRKVLFWICFFAGCAILGYLYLVLIGFPSWMPQFMHHLADRLPGVN